MGCMVIAAVVFISVNGNITVDELLDHSPESKWIAAIIVLVLYALKSQTVVILYGVIATAVGVLFDLPEALVLNTLGAYVCVTVPYIIGRMSDGVLTDKVFSKSKYAKKIYDTYQGDAFLVSLILRLLNLPGDLIGLFFGSVKSPYMQYMSGSVLGMLPAMAMYTMLGSGRSVISTAFLICLGINVAGVLLALLAVHEKKKKKEADAHVKQGEKERGTA